MCSTRKPRSPPAFSSLEAAAAAVEAEAAAVAEAEAAAAGDAAAAEAEAAAALEAAADVEDVVPGAVAGAVAYRGALAPSARACPEKACLWFPKAAEARYWKKGEGRRAP
jgi:colicin import membrane protein